MNREQTYELLQMMAAIDRRPVDESDVYSWHYLIGDLEYQVARDAVARWYKRERRRPAPADVRETVRLVRRDRARRQPVPVPDADPDDPRAYQAALAATVHDLAEGTALPRPERPAAPAPPEITQRDGRDPQTVAALRRRCDWCQAAPGERCHVPKTKTPLRGLHPSRLEAAAAEKEER